MDFITILSYRTKVIHAIIIIFAIFISYKIYTAQATAIASLRQSKEIESKKNSLFSSIIESEKRMAILKKYVNNKDVSTIIKRVGAISNDSKIVINSIKPLEKVEFDVYSQHKFSLSITANSYNDAGEFIKNLENNPDVYQIDSATISPAIKDGNVSSENVTMELVISTFLLK